MGKRAKDGFNNPFAKLQGVKSPRKGAEDSPEKPHPAPAPVHLSERELLESAMQGVRRMEKGPHRRPEAPAAPVPELYDPDDEGVELLRAFTEGVTDFDFADSDEHMEGSRRGFGRRKMRDLKAGKFSVQAHLDLHGLIKDAARDEVARFLRDSQLRGLRCVLIIHGRGKGSKDQQPVLKEQLPRWLTRSECGRRVLAFCSAQPHDGGGGAMYVLLRRGR